MVTFTGDDVQALFSHPAHQHGLKLVDTDKLFQCDGCKQLGDELRYRCEACDFDLHVPCSQAPASMEHSMFEGHTLTFFERSELHPGIPPGVTGWCDVCGTPVLGFLYMNLERDLYIHPLCAILPERIVEDDCPVLELQKANGHNCRLCGKAGYRSQFLAYCFQDDDGELVFHVACLMATKYSSDDMQESSTTTGEVSDRTLATVQNAPRRRGKFRRLCKIAYRVAMFTHSAATLNPLGVIAALTGRV
ncbi:unnamed protein product [Alopecurus aequalis]